MLFKNIQYQRKINFQKKKSIFSEKSRLQNSPKEVLEKIQIQKFWRNRNIWILENSLKKMTPKFQKNSDSGKTGFLNCWKIYSGLQKYWKKNLGEKSRFQKTSVLNSVEYCVSCINSCLEKLLPMFQYLDNMTISLTLYYITKW